MLARCLATLLACTCTLAFTRPVHAGPSRAAQSYEDARRSYYALKRDPQKQKFRHHWIKAIAAFTQVADSHPKSPEAPRALYTAAELWNGLHAVSRRASDLDQAIANYDRVAREHPKSSLADDALMRQAELWLERRGDRRRAARKVREVLARYPKSDMAGQAKTLASRLRDVPAEAVAQASDEPGAKLFGRREEAGAAPQVLEFKHWSNPEYTRVAIYLTGPAQVRTGESRDKGDGSPQLFVDIEGIRLPDELRAPAIQDELLDGVSLVAREDGTVRVTLDLKREAQHRIMVLENPYRVVVDAFTEEKATAEALTKPRKRKVVLDAGHGGKDTGAIGRGGTREKDVVLAIATEAAQLLAAAGVEPVLTRSDDTFVPLEERTAMANRLGADVFVSIHTNAAPQRSVRGVETYYLDVTDDRYALRLAARENATSEEQVSDAQLILADLATKLTTRTSRDLAESLQSKLMRAIRKKNAEARDHGIKSSLFYVLLGARMPAVLVETGFISNPEEEKLLAAPAYRSVLAKAIASAVEEQLRAPLYAAKP